MPAKQQRQPSIISSMEEPRDRISLLIERLKKLTILLEDQTELPVTLPTEQLYHLTTLLIEQIESANKSPEKHHLSPPPSIVQQSRTLTTMLIARLEQHVDLPTEELMQLVTSMITQLDTVVEPSSKPPNSWTKSLSEQLSMHFTLIAEKLRMLFGFLWELLNMLFYPVMVVVLLWLLWLLCSLIGLQLRKVFAPKLIEHPLTEKYAANCPPNFRYYPNYEKVLGMEERLYPSLSQPNKVVEKHYKRAMTCWHADKGTSHKGLSTKTMKEILELIDDSKEKLMIGAGYPREAAPDLNYEMTGIKTKGRVFLESGERVYKSAYWNTTVETSLVLYNNSAPCDLATAVSRLFHPKSSQLPTSEAELKSYHVCNIKTLARQYYFAYEHIPHPEFPFWYHGLGRGPFDMLFWAYGTRLGWFKPPGPVVSVEEKERLVETGWFDRSHVFAKGNMTEEIAERYDMRVQELVDRQIDEHGHRTVFLSDHKPKTIWDIPEYRENVLRAQARSVADYEFGLQSWTESAELPMGWWEGQLYLIKNMFATAFRKNGNDTDHAESSTLPPPVPPPPTRPPLTPTMHASYTYNR